MPVNLFDISSEDSNSAARTGILRLAHGNVTTPAFMPVGTSGTVKAMLHSSLSEIGYNLILGNTYHLFLRPGMDVVKTFGGLHNFSSWDGNILTDSGGYQVFSLAPFRSIDIDGVTFRSHIDGSSHRFTPESVVDIQCTLGSDILMQLDVCTPPGITEKEGVKAMQITSAWALRSKKYLADFHTGYKGYLFGIVQGNFFEKLRMESAAALVDLNLPGYAIGGLSVGEQPEDFKKFLHFTSPLLPDDKPKYVMGIGTPDYLLEAVEAGIDIFDCVHPTRTARNGSCFTLDGMINLRNARFGLDKMPLQENCLCPACRFYSRAYLRHLFMAKEILGPMLATWHNLQFLYTMMANIRESIKLGKFVSYKTDFLKRFESGGLD